MGSSSISNVEVLQTLIGIAKDIRADIERDDDGLTAHERAFYDALAEHDKAVDVLGNAELCKIAVELVKQLQNNVTVDWHQKESVRARLRILVKKILKKYGYPPDLSPAAIKTVLAQAETLLSGSAK